MKTEIVTKIEKDSNENQQKNWKELTLEKIAELSKEVYLPNHDEELSYIGLEHIDQQTLSLNSIGKSTDVTSSKFRFKNGDILFGKLRPYFRKVYRPKFSGICSTDIWVVRAKSQIDQSWLFYLLTGENFIKLASGGSSGTRMPRADWHHLKDTAWLVPELFEQKRIAEILSSLDDKIELNRKMNSNLEKIASLLFKQWFIDVNNQRIGKVSDLIRVESGFSFSSSMFDEGGNYKLVTIKNVQDGYFVTECTDSLSTIPEKVPLHCRLNNGDILLSLTGNVGRVCVIYGDNYLLNQRVANLIPINERDRAFTYFLFRQKDFQDDLIGISRGTAQQNLSPIETKSLEIMIPSENELDRFANIMNPIFQKIVKNYSEIKKLSMLRDLLLPRLMNGKIRVKI